MKIQRLKISNFRGVVLFDEELRQESAIFTGENGTGKSGIIDAVDFLFNARIRRLTGAGSAELHLDKHGKHIDKSIDESYVGAVIALPNNKKIEVQRGLKSKKLKKISGSDADFAAFEETCGTGQQLLSRREILKFITCEAGERLRGMQELLDLSEADKIRTDLSASVKKIERIVSDAKLLKLNAETAIKLSLCLSESSSAAWLATVNKIRSVFRAPPLPSLTESTDVLNGVTWTSQASPVVTKTLFIKCMTDLELSSFPDLPSDENGNYADQYWRTLMKCLSFPDFSESLKQSDFIHKGIELLADQNNCPLCDQQWEPGELVQHLKTKRERGRLSRQLQADYARFHRPIDKRIEQLCERLKTAFDLALQAKESELSSKLWDWRNSLIERRSQLLDATTLSPQLGEDTKMQVDLLLYPTDYLEIKECWGKVANGLPEESVQETSYKSLIAVQAALKNWHKAQREEGRADLKLRMVKKIDIAFAEARTALFETLYKDIEADFVKFYRFLNADDESEFEALLVDQGKSVELKVDFFKRGKFPPHAVHSEGHQDSMGICLYLALMKRLQAEDFKLALLDDIMMSIDTNHRKRMCELLRTQFPHTQFLITTHDRIWSKQMNQHGVVKPENTYSFAHWSLETGPIHNRENGWKTIAGLVAENKITDAAAKLRRTMENDFQDIAEALRSKVTFKSTASWDLGELKGSTFGAFKDALEWSRHAAEKFGNQAQLSQLNAIQSRYKEALKRASVNDWEINPIVHYNSWQNFSKSELASTVEASKDLISAFSCDKCASLYCVLVSPPKFEPNTFGCDCSKFPMLRPKKESRGG